MGIFIADSPWIKDTKSVILYATIQSKYPMKSSFYYFLFCFITAHAALGAMELPESLKKSSHTIANYLEDNPDQKVAHISIHGHVLKDLAKQDLSTEESCAALLTKHEPEELVRIISAADFLDVPALLSASLRALKDRLLSKDSCVFYNAYPEKLTDFVDSVTPPMQHSLERLFSSHTDFKNAQQITTNKIFTKRPRALVRRSDNIIIVGKKESFDCQKSVSRVDLENGGSEKIVLRELCSAEKLVYNDAGTLYALSRLSYDKKPEVSLFDVSEPRFPTFLKDLPNTVDRIAFAGPEDCIIIGSPQHLGLWNSATGKRICTVDISQYSSSLNCLATHQKSCTVALSIVASKSIHWYKSSKQGLEYAQSSDFCERVISALAFNTQGTILAVGCYDETISLVCPTKKTILTAITLNYIPEKVCFSHQDTLFVLPKNDSGKAHLIVPKKLPLLQRIATTIIEKLPASTVNAKIVELSK